ncbi:MAG: S49 family peptidase [Hyphomicrobiales bacterium]
MADGRVYSGRQALAEKLIDALGTEEDARPWLASEKKIDAALKTITREPPADKDRPRFNISLGRAALDWLGAQLGLSGLGAAADRQKLDGLLVLWHPAQ